MLEDMNVQYNYVDAVQTVDIEIPESNGEVTV
jgi:hypothetical protein